MKSLHSNALSARRQRGFTLIEMMVAVAIGLVVALGFAVSFVSLKSTYNTTDQFSQLQDNERLAMGFLTTSVEESGYYPDSTQASPIVAMPDPNNTYGDTTVGQVIFGQASTSTKSATLSTVYAATGGDGVLTCQGATTPSSTGTVTYRNVFYVDSSANTLNCVVMSSSSTLAAGGAALVTNVKSMDVLYAVDTDSDGNADRYMDAGAVNTAALWGNVKSVRVTLNFINPNTAPGQASTIQWVQTINLMNKR